MPIPAPIGPALIYEHPQGKVIYVYPDGSMETWKPDGKRGSSSATPEKLAAGYGGWILRSSGRSAPAPKPYVAPSEEAIGLARGVRLAMTYAAAEVEDLETIAADKDVVLEQKLDGTRCLAVISRKFFEDPVVWFLGRNGQPLKHAAAAKHFPDLAKSLSTLLDDQEGEIVLDGEIMSEEGVFWVFDMPFSDATNVEKTAPTDQWAARRLNLLDIADDFDAMPRRNVRLVPTAIDPTEKAQLIEAVERTGGEGLMVKNAYAPYEPGVRVSHSLKVKYIKTADVIVLARDDKGKKNASLGVAVEWGMQDLVVYVNGREVPVKEIGNCSMIGKDDAWVGEVIEVKYLYVGAGGKLYQPRMARIRGDRDPESCTMDQFKTYSKAVIE